MVPESGPPRSPNGPVPPDGARDGKGEPGRDSLPPPMFPPGARRRHVRATTPHRRGDEAEQDEALPADAFYSPDEPLRRPGVLRPDGTEAEDARLDESAFISPDEPIVRTRPPHPPADYEEVLGAWTSPDEVVVTGIGDPHLSDEDLEALERFGDPHVADLFRALDRLTDLVRAKGQAGLKTSPDMTPFEVSLRAYCVGYLAGRRQES